MIAAMTFDVVCVLLFPAMLVGYVLWAGEGLRRAQVGRVANRARATFGAPASATEAKPAASSIAGRRDEANRATATGYVTRYVTKRRPQESDSQIFGEKWLAALDDFRNWLLRKAA
jgi:hypothetical protein